MYSVYSKEWKNSTIEKKIQINKQNKAKQLALLFQYFWRGLYMKLYFSDKKSYEYYFDLPKYMLLIKGLVRMNGSSKSIWARWVWDDAWAQL